MLLLRVLIFYKILYREWVECGVIHDIMTLNGLSMEGYFVKVPKQFTPSNEGVIWDNRYLITDVYEKILSTVDRNEIPNAQPGEAIKACKMISEMLSFSFRKERFVKSDYKVPARNFKIKEPARTILFEHSICNLITQRWPSQTSVIISTSTFTFNWLFGPVVDSNRLCFLTSARGELMDIATYRDTKPQDGIRFFSNTFYFSQSEDVVSALTVALASNNEKRTLYTYAPVSEIKLDPEIWKVPASVKCLRRTRYTDRVVEEEEAPTSLSSTKKGKNKCGKKGKGKVNDETEISLDDLIKNSSKNRVEEISTDEIDVSGISLDDLIGSSSKNNINKKSNDTKKESVQTTPVPSGKRPQKPQSKSKAAVPNRNKDGEKLNRVQFVDPPQIRSSRLRRF